MDKTMTKFFSKIAMVVAILVGATACTSWLEVDESQSRYISLGTLDPITRTIKGDFNEVLYITEIGINTSESEIMNSTGRVCFNYSVLKRNYDEKGSINIRLNEFYPLVIDEIRPLAIMSDEERELLGTTPVYPTQASISGGFVNLQLAHVDTGDKDVTFEFELVYDDTEGGSTDNTIVFDIRHKGEKVNKQPSDSGSYSYQWASFEFSDELLEKYGNKSAYELLVVFRYKWWNNAGEVVDNVAQLSTSPYSDTTF